MRFEELKIEDLKLDTQNPRYDIDVKPVDESQCFALLVDNCYLEDIADSLDTNGFINGLDQPIVLSKAGIYIVLDGNRRIAAIKLLQNKNLSLKYQFSYNAFEGVIQHIKTIECFIVEDREEARPSIAIRHINGVLKWEARERAAYIHKMFIKYQNKELGL